MELVERVRPLVRDAVCRKLQLFAPFPHISAEDLVQTALIKVLDAMRVFEPSKGSISTWVNRAAGFAIIDAWRQCRRQARQPVVHGRGRGRPPLNRREVLRRVGLLQQWVEASKTETRAEYCQRAGCEPKELKRYHQWYLKRLSTDIRRNISTAGGNLLSALVTAVAE